MRISIDGVSWMIDGRSPHPDSPAEGLLVNVRMVNCVFEDDRTDVPAVLDGFDPMSNTQRFIARIPDYATHGVCAFTVGLQGGMPGYEGAVNSAFAADGALRDSYLQRVSRVIEAADDNGCAVILSCFYQRQHSHERALVQRHTIHAAVANTARWVRQQGYGNVLLEIANEFAHAGYANWPDGAWLQSPAGQVELIETARVAAPDLLVSTSGMGSGAAFEAVARAGDFTIIHFNNTETDAIAERVLAAQAYGKPVVCNEDDKIGTVGAEAARLTILSGGGWGFMHQLHNQSAPFAFDGRQDDPDVYDALSRLTSDSYDATSDTASPTFAVITQPKDGDTFVMGDLITVRVMVSASRQLDQPRVQVLAGDMVLGQATEAPWNVTWQAAIAGAFDLVAIVLEANGEECTRANPVDIVVVPQT
jgi:hypothetical protein